MGSYQGYSFVKTGNFCHPNISFSYETEPVNNHCRKLPVILHASRLVIIPDLVSYHLVEKRKNCEKDIQLSLSLMFSLLLFLQIFFTRHYHNLCIGGLFMFMHVYVYNLLIDFGVMAFSGEKMH